MISIENTPAELQAVAVIRPCQDTLTRVFELVGKSYQQVLLVKRNEGLPQWGNRKRRTGDAPPRDNKKQRTDTLSQQTSGSFDAVSTLMKLKDGPTSNQPQGPGLQRSNSVVSGLQRSNSQQARAANTQNMGTPSLQPNAY